MPTPRAARMRCALGLGGSSPVLTIRLARSVRASMSAPEERRAGACGAGAAGAFSLYGKGVRPPVRGVVRVLGTSGVGRVARTAHRVGRTQTAVTAATGP